MLTNAPHKIYLKSHLQRYFFEVGVPHRLPLQGLLHRDTEERLGRMPEYAVGIPPRAPSDPMQMPRLIDVAVSAMQM